VCVCGYVECVYVHFFVCVYVCLGICVVRLLCMCVRLDALCAYLFVFLHLQLCVCFECDTVLYVVSTYLLYSVALLAVGECGGDRLHIALEHHGPVLNVAQLLQRGVEPLYQLQPIGSLRTDGGV
jgi:hypothetical protein